MRQIKIIAAAMQCAMEVYGPIVKGRSNPTTEGLIKTRQFEG